MRFPRQVVASSVLAACALVASGGEGAAQSPAVKCVVQSAVTSPDQVTFTVGPEDCNVPVPMATFSAYDLRANGGKVMPYAGQVAVDHVTGRDIGAGTYTWATDSEGTCGAQWDFYSSPPQETAPHTTWFPGILGRGVAWFHITADGCEEPEPTVTPVPTPEPSVTATPPADIPPAATPEPTPRVKLIPPPPVYVPPAAVQTPTPSATPTVTPEAPAPAVTPVVPRPASTGQGVPAEERDSRVLFVVAGLLALFAVLVMAGRRR